MIGLTKVAAKEFSGRNITVNAIAPGLVATDMTAVLTEEQKKMILDAVPLKRLGNPEDMAGAVSFLLSEDAAYITGVILRVDGGMAIGT